MTRTQLIGSTASPHHHDAVDALLQELDGAHEHVEALCRLHSVHRRFHSEEATCNACTFAAPCTPLHAAFCRMPVHAPTLSKVSCPSTGRIEYRSAPVSASRYLTTSSCSFKSLPCAVDAN